MKKPFFRRLTTVVACVVALALVSAGLCACAKKPKTPSPVVWYLSLASEDWATYDSATAIPERVRFTEDGGTFSLSVELDEGEQFFVRAVGSSDRIGYDALFSTAPQLVEGDDGALKVASAGTFALAYADGTLTYAYTAPAAGELSGVTLDRDTLLLELNASATLVASFVPSNAAPVGLLWDSKDPAVATVSPEGLVTAVGYGSTTVTVTTATGGFSDTCTVTVRKPVTSIALEPTSLKLVAGGSEKTVSVVFAPSDATDKTFSYTVTDGSSFVSVTETDGALSLRGIAEGSATLTVTSTDNASAVATLAIEVLAPGSVLADLPQHARITLDETVRLEPVLDGAEIESVEWATANDVAVSLVADGNAAVVTGLAFGSSSVTALVHAVGGATYRAKTEVLVTEPYFFLYGIGFGTKDWEWEPYVASEQAAADAGVLMTEESTGIWTLTRRLVPTDGFQIIFPSVASFEDADAKKWNKNIPSDLVGSGTYFDNARSDFKYIANESAQFKINTPGIYKITLDLTGESAKVYIKLVSLLATDITLSYRGADVLRFGEPIEIGVSWLPEDALVTAEDVELTVTAENAEYAALADLAFDFESATATLSLRSEPPERFSVTVQCRIGDATDTLEVSVLPSTEEIVPVSTIAFEQAHYYVNINNGGRVWEQIVTASVNADATVRQVRYSDATDYTQLGQTLSAALRPTVDAVTGRVTARFLGTVTIRATALGDPTKTATCLVTFYSDQFYLIGNKYGSWDSVLSPSVTTTVGSRFSGYTFTKVSETHFQYLLNVASYDETDQGFRIAFCGMDAEWVSAIGSSCRLNSYSTAEYGWTKDYANGPDSKNTVIVAPGKYLIDLDLSRHMALWTLDHADEAEPSSLVLDIDEDSVSLKKDEELRIGLAYFPRYLTFDPESVECTVAGAEKTYLDATFDYGAMTVVLRATDAEFSEDVPLTLTVTYKELSASLSVTVVAQHNLVWASDNKTHWQRCMDDGCDYASEPVPHEVGKEWSSDATGHYHECTVCGGYKVDNEPHSFLLDAEGYYAKGLVKCLDCGYVIYETSVNANGATLTLTKYNGSFEKIRLPAEIGGRKLVAIGAGAFAGNEYLKRIEFSANITDIGNTAFDGCVALESVTIPATVATLGGYAFRGCTALTSADLSAMTAALPSGLFDGCSLLSDVRLPSDADEITVYMFRGCSSLVSIGIPTTVATIGNSAFEGCSLLSDVRLSAGLTKIGQAAFADCVSLASIDLPQGLSVIQNRAFAGCKALRSAVVPSSVSGKIDYVYSDCTNLETVEIFGQVTSIDQCFKNCKSLRKAVIHSKALDKMRHDWGFAPFFNCDALEEVYFAYDPLYVEYFYGNYETNVSITPEDRTLFDIDGVKHAYVYSYGRPAADAYLGPFADWWHYDDEGQIVLWKDTPVTEGDDSLARDMSVNIRFMGAAGCWNKRPDNIMFSGDGVINPGGNLSVTVNWTMTDAYSESDPTVTFRISVDGRSSISYDDKYTFSQLEFTPNAKWTWEKNRTPIWYADTWYPPDPHNQSFKIPKRNYLNRTFAFTFTFDARGLLLSFAVTDVTETADA